MHIQTAGVTFLSADSSQNVTMGGNFDSSRGYNC